MPNQRFYFVIYVKKIWKKNFEYQLKSKAPLSKTVEKVKCILRGGNVDNYTHQLPLESSKRLLKTSEKQNVRSL